MEAIRIEEIRKQAQPIVEIPGFQPGEVARFRLQMPNLLKMAEQGRIPNNLLDIAASLSGVGGAPKQAAEPSAEEKLIRAAKTIELYCRACMVEPTYDEAGEYLTDEQVAFIFNWGRGDIKALEPFRNERRNGANNNNRPGVQKKTK